MSLRVRQPGLLSLLQDRGRFGQHHLGLTTGGPMDLEAFLLCQRLLGNDPNCTLVECSFGGLELDVETDTLLCVTGAEAPLLINGQPRDLWTGHRVQGGDRVQLGHAEHGCRNYIGVVDGFAVTPQFGSTATVLREGLGGLRGEKLAPGDVLPCRPDTQRQRLQLAAARGNTLAVLFRPREAAHQHSPAALRLQMSAYREVHILKQRSGLQDINIYLPPEDDVPHQPQLWELPADESRHDNRAVS